MDTETKREPFECSLLRGTATIVTTFAVHYSSRQGAKEPDKITPLQMGCENAGDCGVKNARGGFDWARCVHPKLRRR